ncbi:MAG: 30S ribosomal protein S20 [Pseudomonadota bacterium]|nr:30S ribosomal protein S20 [Pseudomonadota bacterium]
MANSNQSRKRARQAESRRKHNAGRRSMLRTSIKKVLKAISAQEKEDATLAFQTAVPIVDKMAGKRIIHKNKAARIKSRLARKIKLISA